MAWHGEKTRPGIDMCDRARRAAPPGGVAMSDSTPTAHLRRARLARAHEQLLAAQPGDGTTVADVAAR
ncbi:hypothetical protein KRM28CT15_41140 [Krasilnikovia sp. M28-CT-15]